jgi:hypothetical protein
MDKKQKREEQMAQVREEILASRPKPTASQSYGHAGYKQAAFHEDPAGIAPKKQKSRNKVPDDMVIKHEPSFNSYITQLEEPRSFLNLLPESVKKTALMIPEDLLGKDEEDMLKILEDRYKYKPTAAVEAMRNNFWMEHDRVSVTRNEIINQSNIYLGIVSKEYFYKVLDTAPHIIAYILCRPPEYEAVMKGLLSLSTRKIRDVLNIPLQKADGSIQDPKIIELVLKAAAMVDLRAKGGYIQRSETKNLTLMKQENSYTNVFSAAGSTKTMDLSTLTTDIDAKIAALEKEMQAIPGMQAALDESLPSSSPTTLEVSYTKVEDVDV